jgi:hypothetical protein
MEILIISFAGFAFWLIVSAISARTEMITLSQMLANLYVHSASTRRSLVAISRTKLSRIAHTPESRAR